MNFKTNKKRLTKNERMRLENRQEQISQLDLAYEQLNKDYPELFKGCPLELPSTRVKKTSVAKEFDDFSAAGVCFEEEYWEREANTLTGEASESEEKTVEGDTLYFKNSIATAEHAAEVRSKHRDDFVSYSFMRQFEGDRAYAHSQKQDSCYVEPGKTGTGKPEENVEPFDGYAFPKPKHQKEAFYVVDKYNYLQHEGYTIPRLTLDCLYHCCQPGTNSVTEFLPNGLETQLKEFGKKIFIPVGRKGQSKKYEKKTAALVNALSRAFAPRNMRPSEGVIKSLSLDTCPAEGNESAWTPLTAEPMDIIIDEEQQEIRARKARHELVKVRNHLGADKWVLLMESLKKTNAQIAAEINANGGDTNVNCIQKRVRRIRKALQQLGCPF